MKRRLPALLRCSAVLLPCCFWLDCALADGLEPPAYWRDNWRGWHFYEEPEPEAPAENAADPASPAFPPQVASSDEADLAAFKRLQKAVEDYRHVAIMRPSEANVRRYMELESRVVNQASYFADVAQRIAWATPDLDPSLQGRPTNTKALEVFEQQERQERASTVAELGKDHVLLFFYRSDCPYCHAFAPVIGAFEARHGMGVVAISVDGDPLPGFPNARPDNGIASTLQVNQVPAVYLAQPFTGLIVPIGFGVLTESQLLERITKVTDPASALLDQSRQQVPLLQSVSR